MSSEHPLLVASHSMSIQQFPSSMPSSPPTRGATPNSNVPSSLPSNSPTAGSFDAPTLQYPQPLMSLSTAVNISVHQQENTTPTSGPDPNAEVDPQIIEALKSKDRLFMLKCGETMESLVREPSKMRVEVTANTSYQRMLVHRCSTFYKTVAELDQITKVFFITLTPDSRIPERKISDLVPAEPTPQPAIKIMRRTPLDRRPRSQANSVAGDDTELSDIEPSESGSLGGKSSSARGHTKNRPTIEEREAAYKEARSRIFLGFEEKEKGNMNSSSSSLSLTSSSAGAGSSAGDLDDSSSPATESEWSPSNPRENRKEYRRESVSSSRNGRSNFNGAASVRNSRASSPSFKYASIYDSPQTTYYDHHAQYPEPSNPGYHLPPYPIPYPPPPGHPANIPFSPPYPYYGPFNPYQQPPPLQHLPVDSMPSTSGDMYPGSMTPGNNYQWPSAIPPTAQHPQPHLPSQPNPNQMMNVPPPSQGPPYIQYPVPSYPYPAPAFYPPSGQMVPPYPNPAPGPLYDMSRPPNGNAYGPMNPGRTVSSAANVPPNNSASNSTNNGRNIRSPVGANQNGSKGRIGPPPPPRSGVFGPGIGIAGYMAPQPSGGEVVGPRLNSSRRTGNASRSSSSINDDVSSTASSSTTSSSSRRTFMSTTSSQHPLPPRPDWAVAMTMAPSNHPHGRHNHHDHHSRSGPANRNGNNSSSATMPPPSSAPGPMPPLQPTDFPPLTSATVTPERRPPNTMGAWGNTNIRSALVPDHGQQHPSVKSYPNPYHFDDSDQCFERPPPKTAELYNHKSGRRFTANDNGGNGRAHPDAVKDQLADQVAAMSFASQGPSGAVAHGAPQELSLTVPFTLKVGT